MELRLTLSGIVIVSVQSCLLYTSWDPVGVKDGSKAAGQDKVATQLSITSEMCIRDSLYTLIIKHYNNISGGKLMKTYMASASTIERKWYVVDAADYTLGRLASQVNPSFTVVRNSSVLFKLR